MKGIIFDQPAVAEIAKNFIKEYEMEDRMEVLGGDYLQNSIGGEYDLIWASGCLYYGKDNMDSLMKKIYDALNPGGVFISYHEGVTHERTKPGIMVLSWPLGTLTGQDFISNRQETTDFNRWVNCCLVPRYSVG